MLNLTLSAAPLSHLKRLVSTSKASIDRRAALAPLLQPLPKFKLRPLSLRNKLTRFGPFDKELCQFSTRSLAPQRECKSFCGFNNLKTNGTPVLLSPLAWCLFSTKNSTAVRLSYVTLTPPLAALNPQYLKLISKRLFFTMQIPHK
jgi:hypothetical protein